MYVSPWKAEVDESVRLGYLMTTKSLPEERSTLVLLTFEKSMERKAKSFEKCIKVKMTTLMVNRYSGR